MRVAHYQAYTVDLVPTEYGTVTNVSIGEVQMNEISTAGSIIGAPYPTERENLMRFPMKTSWNLATVFAALLRVTEPRRRHPVFEYLIDKQVGHFLQGPESR